MKPNRTRSIIFSIVTVLYIAAVAYLCFANFKKLPDLPKLFLGIPTDKVVHFCMFFPFPILAYLAYDRYTDTPLKAFAALISIFAIGCIFAGVTEIIHRVRSPTGARTPETSVPIASPSASPRY